MSKEPNTLLKLFFKIISNVFESYIVHKTCQDTDIKTSIDIIETEVKKYPDKAIVIGRNITELELFSDIPLFHMGVLYKNKVHHFTGQTKNTAIICHDDIKTFFSEGTKYCLIGCDESSKNIKFFDVNEHSCYSYDVKFKNTYNVMFNNCQNFVNTVVGTNYVNQVIYISKDLSAPITCDISNIIKEKSLLYISFK